MKAQLQVSITIISLFIVHGFVRADDRVGVHDLHLGDPRLSAESFLGPIDFFACDDPGNRLDLRCSFVDNLIGPDGAMYVYVPQPVPGGAQCIRGDSFSVPCQRRSIYRRRLDSSPQLLVYVDDRLDADSANSHLAELLGIYLDPVTCDLFVWLESYCYGQTTDCTLYDPAREVFRIHGLKGSKCSLN